MDYDKNGRVINDLSKLIVPMEICNGIESIWLRVKERKERYESINNNGI